MRDRVKKLQDALKKDDVDLAILTDRENIIYFTGLTEIEAAGLVIPKSGEAFLVVLRLDAPYYRDKTEIEIVPYVYGRDTLASRIADEIIGRKLDYKNSYFSRYFIETATYLTLKEKLPGLNILDGGEVFYKVRSIKDEDEIANITKASEIISKGMEKAVEVIKPGIREIEIIGEAEKVMRYEGAQEFPFRMQVLNEDRQMMAHPFALEEVIKDNQLVVIHLGARVNGYSSKMTRTVQLGEVDDDKIEIYNILKEAQKAAMDKVRPGMTAGELYAVAEEVVNNSKYPKSLIYSIGHGVGIRQSEFYPIIAKNSDVIIENNMVLDFIYPSLYVKGKGGARICDTLLVKDGAKVLTKYTNDLVVKK